MLLQLLLLRWIVALRLRTRRLPPQSFLEPRKRGPRERRRRQQRSSRSSSVIGRSVMLALIASSISLAVFVTIGCGSGGGGGG